MGANFWTCKRGIEIPALVALLGYCKDSSSQWPELAWSKAGKKSSCDRKQNFKKKIELWKLGSAEMSVVMFVFLVCCGFVLFYVSGKLIMRKRCKSCKS